jgi:hypothetical protein
MGPAKGLTTGGTEDTGVHTVRDSFTEFLLRPVVGLVHKRSLDSFGMRLTSLGMTVPIRRHINQNRSIRTNSEQPVPNSRKRAKNSRSFAALRMTSER